MSESLQPHGLYSPWNSPGQNTGVGNHSLLQGIFPEEDRTQVSYIVGVFFISWVTTWGGKIMAMHMKTFFNNAKYSTTSYILRSELVLQVKCAIEFRNRTSGCTSKNVSMNCGKMWHWSGPSVMDRFVVAAVIVAVFHRFNYLEML